jgi:hypothetical protein
MRLKTEKMLKSIFSTFLGASGPKRKDAGGLNVRFTVHAASNVSYDEALLERTWADKF